MEAAPDDGEQIAAWFRRQRKLADLTQAELAARVHCSLSALRKIERVELVPSRELAERLAAELVPEPAARERYVRMLRTGRWADVEEGSGLVREAPAAAARAPFWNVPAPVTALIGRERMLRELTGLMQRDDVRLLTLCGLPGVGKTHLALQLAHELRQQTSADICFVQLGAVHQPELVVETILRSLGIGELGGSAPIRQLLLCIGQRRLLLFLDNFEHLLPAASVISELLGASSSLKVVVTSRVPLGLTGEHQWEVVPLALPWSDPPPPLSRIAQFSAIQLFINRLRAIQPSFRLTPANAADVLAICTSLDGLPLAIELAAGKGRFYTLAELRSYLGQQALAISSTTRDRPQRQQTLEATIMWSYQLLDDQQRLMFLCAGAFSSGATLEALAAVVETVGAASGTGPIPFTSVIESLAEWHMIRLSAGDDEAARFEMLETLRAFARVRLRQKGLEQSTCEAVALQMLAFVEQAAAELQGPGQSVWTRRLLRDQANVEGAIEWALERGDQLLAARFCVAMWWYWYTSGWRLEGKRLLERTLSLGDNLPEELLATLLQAVSGLAYGVADYTFAIGTCQRGLELWRRLGNRSRAARMLNMLALIASERGSYAEAETLLQESLALMDEANDLQGQGLVLNNLANFYLDLLDFETAEELQFRALECRQAVGDTHGVSYSWLNLANIAIETGRHELAITLLEQALETLVSVHDEQGIAYGMLNLAEAQYLVGKPGRAARLLVDAFEGFQQIGDVPGVIICLEQGARLGTKSGTFSAAIVALSMASRLREQLGTPQPPLYAHHTNATLSTLRTALTAEAFALTWRQGQRQILTSELMHALIPDSLAVDRVA